MNRFSNLYGPWALITGASSGLGEAFAHAVATRGVRPLLVARRDQELQRVAADVRSAHGIDCATIALDLADPSFVDTLIDQSESRDIGLVIGNAAYNPVGAFVDMPRNMLMRIIDVNDRANVLLSEAFLPRFRARGRGGLLLVASTEAFTGMPFSSCYSASKAFVLTFGEALWGEYLGTGVDITVLAPGATDTPLFASRDMAGLKVMPMSPRSVAEIGLNHLGRGSYIVPGSQNRWGQRIMRRLPRGWLVRQMAPMVRRMVENSTRRTKQGERP